MTKVELKIAWRYLWGKKSHNAINIVSGVSAAAVMVVTAAMVCVLSVMNGFGVVIEGMFSHLDPDLRIEHRQEASFQTEGAVWDSIRTMDGVAVFSETVIGTALVEYKDQQIPAQLKGVDSLYEQLTEIDSIIVDGHYEVFDGKFYSTVMGIGLSNQLSVGAHFIHGLHLYAPKRRGEVDMLRPEDSFNRQTCFMAGIFAVNQIKYDDKMMLVDIRMARQMFDYDEHEVTAVEIGVDGEVGKVKKAIEKVLGEEYKVMDRYEQQADFFRILKIEKWLTALLMVFILLIASFNIIGSLTMLIIDKRADIRVLRDLGADRRLIRRIFLIEGWLISSLGAILGLVLGVALCVIQEQYGILQLGNGTQYVLSAYPVHVEVMDLIWVTMMVLGLGAVAAWYPAHKIEIENE